MTSDVLIIDTASIISFMRYYHEFYHSSSKEIGVVRKPIFEGLQDFLISKIETGKIFILDKVCDELKGRELESFKESIKNNIIPSLPLIEDVSALIEKYRILENEKFLNDDEARIEAELEKYETQYADLFLIAYANKLKSEGKKVLLITEESIKQDQKLLPKIPFICKPINERIKCRNLPFALFEHFKEEIEIKLEII